MDIQGFMRIKSLASPVTDAPETEIRASSKIDATITQQGGRYFVKGKNKNLGGPYSSRGEAEARLSQVEQYGPKRMVRGSRDSGRTCRACGGTMTMKAGKPRCSKCGGKLMAVKETPESEAYLKRRGYKFSHAVVVGKGETRKVYKHKDGTTISVDKAGNFIHGAIGQLPTSVARSNGYETLNKYSSLPEDLNASGTSEGAHKAWDSRKGSDIQNPNSSGQGFSPSHSENSFHDTIVKHGYEYSHSTPIRKSDGSMYLHHTYTKGGHTVGVSDASPAVWRTSTSTASGRSQVGRTSADLDKHLTSKDKRYFKDEDLNATGTSDGAKKAWESRGKGKSSEQKRREEERKGDYKEFSKPQFLNKGSKTQATGLVRQGWQFHKTVKYPSGEVNHVMTKSGKTAILHENGNIKMLYPVGTRVHDSLKGRDVIQDYGNEPQDAAKPISDFLKDYLTKDKELNSQSSGALYRGKGKKVKAGTFNRRGEPTGFGNPRESRQRTKVLDAELGPVQRSTDGDDAKGPDRRSAAFYWEGQR